MDLRVSALQPPQPATRWPGMSPPLNVILSEGEAAARNRTSVAPSNAADGTTPDVSRITTRNWKLATGNWVLATSRSCHPSTRTCTYRNAPADVQRTRKDGGPSASDAEGPLFPFAKRTTNTEETHANA